MSPQSSQLKENLAISAQNPLSEIRYIWEKFIYAEEPNFFVYVFI